MKSEQRHELKTNELKRLATQVTHASEEYVSRHSTLVVGAICVALLVIAGVVYSARSSAGTPEAWGNMMSASSVADFANIADKYPGTPVGAWARLREGEQYLTTGVQAMFVDRDAAVSDLNKAREAFEKLLGDATTPPEVRERALYGLARTLESYGDEKNVGLAVDKYKQLLNEFQVSIYKPLADARIAALETPDAKAFNTWFAGQKPKPKDQDLPKDQQLPDFDDPPAGDAKKPAESKPGESKVEPLKSPDSKSTDSQAGDSKRDAGK